MEESKIVAVPKRKDTEEVRRLKQTVNDHEKTIKALQSEAQIKNMFIVNLHKSNIAYKLELGRKLTVDEIEFLKKSCT